MKDESTDDDCSRSVPELTVGTACKAVNDVEVTVEEVVAVVVPIVPWMLLPERIGSRRAVVVEVSAVRTATACGG